ncbi:class I SAM-dependent methyltransferase [Dehalococcoides mccartyi]|nr:class I SAM-dependent methyltransferase [Dehalococcoides mccartyi]
MIGIHDPEGAEKQAIHALVNFDEKDVFEVGCGEGRMTWLYADSAASVLAFDPDEDAINEARQQTPESLQNTAEFRVADMLSVDLKKESYDVGILAWSI